MREAILNNVAVIPAEEEKERGGEALFANSLLSPVPDSPLRRNKS